MEYSHNFGSNFPEELIEIEKNEDVDDKVGSVISQYYSFINSEDISSAHDLYKKYETILKPYMIDMALINRCQEEIFNVGLCALKKMTQTITSEEPLDFAENGYWYKDY